EDVGEVVVAAAGGTIARPCEGGAGEGVGPSAAAISGPEHQVGARPGSTPASFVHAGDVHVACNQVAGDLDIADEGAAGGQLVRGPSETVVSGDADEEGPSPNIEVVPRNVHVPKVQRAGVVVGPTRLSVVKGAVVNAEMGPAIRVRGIGGLISAHPLTAAAHVKKDSKPSLAWLVEQNNGVAQGIGERALTGGPGEPGEGGAAVGGDRCAGDVDGVGEAAS